MRKLLCLLAILSAGAVAQTPAPQSPTQAKSLAPAVLTDGTPVKLRVGAGINTASVRVGDELQLDVAEEIRMDDVTVIPTTSAATVVVTSQGTACEHPGAVVL